MSDIEWRAFIDAADAARLVPLELLEQTYKVNIEKGEIGGVSVYEVTPVQISPENQDRMFFHVHGGAYVLGGGDNAVAEAVQVAAASGMRALSVDYRMPPEFYSPPPSMARSPSTERHCNLMHQWLLPLAALPPVADCH